MSVAAQGTLMCIRISVPTMLREDCSGQAQIESLRVGTVQAVLKWLSKEYPQLYRSVCDETDAVRPHVNLFVNDAFLHELDGLQTELTDGDVLSIMPAVSGG